jgi:hypothetical protein
VKGNTLAARRARTALFYTQALERAADQGEQYARACALCGGWPPEGEAALRERMRVHARTLEAAFPDPGPLRPRHPASECANSDPDLHNGPVPT